MKQLDINCDVGEGVGNEAKLMPYIQSCNIACGGHAGDLETMRQVVGLAKQHKVKVGAHPSYPDRLNFGRKSIKMDSQKFIESIQSQVNSLNEVAQSLSVTMDHIKPHGALYNDIAKDKELAQLFLKAINPYKKNTKIVVPYKSEIASCALGDGFSIIYEGFADRNYNDDLSLVARSEKGAVITNSTAILTHLLEMFEKEEVTTITGGKVTIKADTFCVHSDTENADEIVRKIAEATQKYHKE